jgi:hypothetical protein
MNGNILRNPSQSSECSDPYIKGKKRTADGGMMNVEQLQMEKEMQD